MKSYSFYFALAMAMTAHGAHAAEFQSPIAFDKPSYSKGDTAVASIKGKGQCKNIEIDWGDGQKSNLGDFAFGQQAGVKVLNANHQYNTPGNFNVQVKSAGGGGGGGHCAPITGLLAVKQPAPAIQLGSASQMAAIINNDNCPNPDITGGLGAFKPNSAVAIGGCKFGASVGQVWLRGMGTGNGGSDVQLIVDSWTDKGIGIKIPAIEGTPEKEITLDVVTSAGVHIKKPVTFKPEIVTRLLKKSDFPNADCSANNVLVKDTCVATNQTYQGQNCGFTVCAQHKIPSGIVVPTPVKADDVFAMNLKHGWKYEKASLGFTNSGADFNGIHTMPVGAQPKGENASGGTSVNYKVSYGLPGSGSWVEYKLDIYVTGPKGVPYQ